MLKQNKDSKLNRILIQVKKHNPVKIYVARIQLKNYQKFKHLDKNQLIKFKK